MLRMTTISKIRHEHFVNGKSPHQISQEQNISWATVKGYLEKSPDESKLGLNQVIYLLHRLPMTLTSTGGFYV